MYMAHSSDSTCAFVVELEHLMSQNIVLAGIFKKGTQIKQRASKAFERSQHVVTTQKSKTNAEVHKANNQNVLSIHCEWEWRLVARSEVDWSKQEVQLAMYVSDCIAHLIGCEGKVE